MKEIRQSVEIYSYSFRAKDGRLHRDSDTKRDLVVPETMKGDLVQILGKNLFYGLNLDTVSLPPKLRIIEDAAFCNNKLVNVIIPRKVEFIGYLSFADNPLTKIVLPPSLTFIDDEAFLGTANPVIICQVDSYAQRFAEEHGFDRKVLAKEEFDLYYEP